MSRFTVLFDACVLYPALLRSLLMYLAETDLFRARWTEQIHDEWMRNVLSKTSTREKLERTRDLMNAHVRDALVTGFEELIPSLVLPDADDRHVLAAAIHGRADVIVTKNLKDFPAETLARYGIEAQHPDQFIQHLLDLDPFAVCEAVKCQRQSLKNPPMTVAEFLDCLERQELPQTVALLCEFAETL